MNTDFFASPQPRAIGHRGSAGTHPENTLVSFRAAVDAGAPYIEFDLHTTRDGEIVVSHDDNLMRIATDDRLIREMTYAELAKVDAGKNFTIDGVTFPFRNQGVQVPRFEEVLASFPQICAIVEVKQAAPSLVASMLAAIDRAGMRRRVLVASEHQEPLDEIRRLAPDIATNFSYFESGFFLQAMVSRDPAYQPPGAAVQISRRYGSWELVTVESVAFAHSLGLELHVWTVNDPLEMNELLNIGVDGLISDFPRRALDVIRSRAASR